VPNWKLSKMNLSELLPGIYLQELKKTTKYLKTNHVTVTLGATYFLAYPSYKDTDGKGSHIFKPRFTYTKFHLKNQAYRGRVHKFPA